MLDLCGLAIHLTHITRLCLASTAKARSSFELFLAAACTYFLVAFSMEMLLHFFHASSAEFALAGKMGLPKPRQLFAFFFRLPAWRIRDVWVGFYASVIEVLLPVKEGPASHWVSLKQTHFLTSFFSRKARQPGNPTSCVHYVGQLNCRAIV